MNACQTAPLQSEMVPKVGAEPHVLLAISHNHGIDHSEVLSSSGSSPQQAPSRLRPTEGFRALQLPELSADTARSGIEQSERSRFAGAPCSAADLTSAGFGVGPDREALVFDGLKRRLEWEPVYQCLSAREPMMSAAAAEDWVALSQHVRINSNYPHHG